MTVQPSIINPRNTLHKLLFLCLLFLVSSLEASIAYHELETMERQVLHMINDERAKEGLPALQEWKELTVCARTHSQNMAQKSVEFGHDGFQDRADEMQEVAFWTKFGENVAFSYNVKDPLKTAVKGWMKSPGHRKNILGDYEETGVGIAFSDDGEFYITQLFATRG